MTKPIKKVAIVGAGPTGLAQLKNLLEVSKSPKAKYELQVKVFESKPDVGGVWYVTRLQHRAFGRYADSRYSTETEKQHRKAVIHDAKGKGKEKMYIYPPGEEEPSPMYEGLRTNLPHVSLSTTTHLVVQRKGQREDRSDE
jgi:cation diffusion facilitator CzcD-associated flavoprotein CzcO